jgi:hypothetical protein
MIYRIKIAEKLLYFWNIEMRKIGKGIKKAKEDV